MIEGDAPTETLATGKAILQQYGIFNELVSLRIALDSLLDAISILPDPCCFERYAESCDREALAKTQASVTELYQRFLQLTQTLCKADKSLSISNLSEDQLSTLISVHLDQIQKEHSISTQTTELTVLDRPISIQVSYLLQDMDRYLKRAYMNVRNVRPLGLLPDDNVDDTEKLESSVTKEVIMSKVGGEDDTVRYSRIRVAPATWRGLYNDTEFFTMLCQDSLQSGGKGSPLEVVQQLKKLQARAHLRQNVPRSIIKDRSIDMTKVFKKLISFVPAVRRPDPEYLRMIRGSLFK
ncbi:hypothetical protein GMRT_12689 [Giardia muris]|uniref:AATF leucine zipper-containing domain-containing protein n=1 Tax=Giardia muris TaxID=5742 RepID=A0A4Z1SXH6_GIAMU|nr:hypothetical protein GMRT_12689 [Giardia muris]|eukprot:TNJ30482.1 hypothetical protein GMRT_12689 [Giardia muris]